MVACSTTLAQAMTMQAHGCSRRWDPVSSRTLPCDLKGSMEELALGPMSYEQLSSDSTEW